MAEPVNIESNELADPDVENTNNSVAQDEHTEAVLEENDDNSTAKNEKHHSFIDENERIFDDNETASLEIIADNTDHQPTTPQVTMIADNSTDHQPSTPQVTMVEDNLETNEHNITDIDKQLNDDNFNEAQNSLDAHQANTDKNDPSEREIAEGYTEFEQQTTAREPGTITEHDEELDEFEEQITSKELENADNTEKIDNEVGHVLENITADHEINQTEQVTLNSNNDQKSSQSLDITIDNNAAATVKFVLMPSGQVVTQRCHLNQTLAELKSNFANELKIPSNILLLMFEGHGANDETTLADLGVGPNGMVQLEMVSADPVKTPLRSIKHQEEYQMPDVIAVKVQAADGVESTVVVEIERVMGKKLFLGGYRNKKTGAEYHHAAVQTNPKPRPPSMIEKNCRDTQTVEARHLQQQTKNDTSTQMTGIGVYIANESDKLLKPGRYQTADDYRKNIFKQVVVIQTYYRRWLAKQTVTKVREDKEAREEWERQEEIRKKREKEERIKHEYERRMNPKTKEDFNLLYSALEKWRLEELERINNSLTGAERKAALCTLLDQETQLLASIGRHQIAAGEENKTESVQSLLNKAAAPKKWKGPDGKVTEMDTPFTIRAKELVEIYNSINMKYLTQDERLDVLLTLKHTVKEHDCKLTQEIIDLIDREADLLMRGVKDSNLEGLRQRISTLFLQYIKTPTFNPEIARLLKVPQDPSSLRKNIYFCSSCNQYLPSTEFSLSSNSRAVGRCRRCRQIDNEGRIRQDFSHYRYMLQALRRAEESYGDDSKTAFLIQEPDLRYLVENVWNSQSVLSAWDDLYDLVLVRWDRLSEWSPWNCVLLTKEEATAHDKLEDVDEAYGKTLIQKVNGKHTLARSYFSRLPGMAERIRESAIKSATQPSHAPAITGRAIGSTA